MTLSDDEFLRLLSRVFDFLSERDSSFSISRPEWVSFCRDHQISEDELKRKKQELWAQFQLLTEDEARRKKLEQIFCCDPFDFQVGNELRNLWHRKSESQLEPFQQWVYDLSVHLLQLEDKATLPPPSQPSVMPTITIPVVSASTGTSVPSSPDYDPRESRQKAIIVGGLIGGGIIGLSILLSTFLLKDSLVKSLQKPTENPEINLSGSLTSPVPTPVPSTISTTPSIAPTVAPSETASIDPEPSPINPQDSPQVNVEEAVSVVKNLYNLLSKKQFNQANMIYSPNLQKQFNASFFNRFKQVTVEDLQVVSRADRAIDLVGINTYIYPDGLMQKEKRSYRVERINGEPKITGSVFIGVLKTRPSEKASVPLESPPVPTEGYISQIKVEDAISLVESLYGLLSEKQFDQAISLYSPSLQWQFKASFFNQFNRVRVENLRVTSMNNGSINLVGVNTYFYPDGSTQRERRSFTVRLIDGEPKLSASRFIKVLKPKQALF